MKLVAVLLVAACALCLVAGQPQEFTAQLSGANQSPLINTNANANYKLTISGESGRWTMEVMDIQNLIMAHIHQGAQGVNGPVIVPLMPGPGEASKMVNGLAQLTTPLSGNQNLQGTFTSNNFAGPLAGKQMSDLVSLIQQGQAYVNVHTTAHPAGEVRGQVMMA